jgi:outer membrane protein OmpA-like peptidoglycan-associated protein
MNFKKHIVLLLLIVLTSSTAFAQRDPSLISSRNYVGIEGGLNYSWMMGQKNFFFAYQYLEVDPGFTFIGALPFSNLGGGLGFHIAGTLDLSFTDFLGLQAKIFYRANNTGTTETTTGQITAIDHTVGQATTENNYQLNFSYIGLGAALRLQFVPESFYGLVGFEYLSTSSVKFAGYQRIVSSDNNTQFVTWPSGNPVGPLLTIDKTDVTNSFNSSQFNVKLGVGTFIPLGSGGWVLTPELNLSIPLTQLFSTDQENAYKNGYVIRDPANDPLVVTATTPNLWQVSLSVALKFPFGATSREEESHSPGEKSDERDTKTKYTNLKGKVSDAKTGKPIKAEVTVTDLNNNEVVAKTSTGSDGLYDIRVKAPGRYSVTADADDYLFGTVYYEVDSDGRILKGNHDLKLTSVADGRTRLLIFFDFNKDNLQPESYPELERAITIMKNHSSMEVEIAGYTDNVGSDTYNKDLSQRRANSVKDYMVKHGIDAKRIQARGYGEQNPILPNDTDEGRAANRRVEFVVLKK